MPRVAISAAVAVRTMGRSTKPVPKPTFLCFNVICRQPGLTGMCKTLWSGRPRPHCSAPQAAGVPSLGPATSHSSWSRPIGSIHCRRSWRLPPGAVGANCGEANLTHCGPLPMHPRAPSLHCPDEFLPPRHLVPEARQRAPSGAGFPKGGGCFTVIRAIIWR